MASFFCCPFLPLDVLDEIWDKIESVSEGFLTFSCILSTKADFLFSVLLVQSQLPHEKNGCRSSEA